MTYLCMGTPTSTITTSRPGRSSTTVNTVETAQEDTVSSQSLVEVKHSSGTEGFALPTFTARIVSEDSSVKVRIFKDGGSQRNFITSNLAKSLNLKILETNVALSIRGFLSKQSVTTDIVEVPVEIGQNSYTVPAICIDSINTSFKINNLQKIVHKITKLGYGLADEDLISSGSNVSDIKLILGSESSFILPTVDEIFGDSRQARLDSRSTV